MPTKNTIEPNRKALIKISEPNIPSEAILSVGEVLKSGNLVQGKCVSAFEEALSDYLGAPYVALVSSGTAALHLSLLALELPKGSGVIVPNFTFPATINAVILAGLKPIIADVDLRTYVVTYHSMRQAITSALARGLEVSAIMPVHEFGQPVDAEALQKLAEDFKLKIIEDAACALGASYRIGAEWYKVGNVGDAACFSFHPRKTLTTGEGGAVVTHSKELYERVCVLRSHGMQRGPNGVQFERPGFNYRMTDFQAALGLTQLPYLDEWVSKRQELASMYHELLADTELLLPPLTRGHSWQTFMVRLPAKIDRDQLIASLRAAGVETNIGANIISRLKYITHKVSQRALADSSLAIPLCEQYNNELLRRVSVKLKENMELTRSR